MDQEPEQQSKRRSPLVLILIIIIVLLAAAAVVLAVGKFRGQQELEPAPVSSEGEGTPTIGYEQGVTVVDDSEALAKAYAEMKEKNAQMGVPLSYRNEAKSLDGENFDCYIANPKIGGYDIFINIYADAELTDQLYLSGLIPPGSAIEKLKLDHKLESGTNRVYVAFTQVESDHATIHQQVMVTMDFVVEK